LVQNPAEMAEGHQAEAGATGVQQQSGAAQARAIALQTQEAPNSEELARDNERLRHELQAARAAADELREEVLRSRTESMAASWNAHTKFASAAREHEERETLLQEACAACERHNKELREQLAGAESSAREQVEELRKALGAQGKAMSAITLEKEKLEKRLNHAIVLNKRLDGEVQKTNQLLQRLEPGVGSELSAIREAMESAPDGRAEFEEEVSRLRGEVSEAAGEARAARQALQSFRRYTEAELADIADTVLSLQEGTQKAKASEAAALRAAADADERVRAERSYARREVELLEKQLAEAQKALKAKEEDAAAAQEAQHRYERECKRLREKASGQEHELWRLRAQVVELSEASGVGRQQQQQQQQPGRLPAAAARRIPTAEERDVWEAKAKMKAAIQRTKNLEEDRDVILRNVKVIEAEMKTLTNSLLREKERSSQLRADLAAATSKQRAAEAALPRLQDDYKEAKASLADHARMLSDMHSDCAMWREEARRWREKADYLQQEYKHLERQKSTDAAKVRQSNMELLDRIQAAEEHATEAKSEMSVMKEMIHTLKAEVRQKEMTERELRRKLKQSQHSQ